MKNEKHFFSLFLDNPLKSTVGGLGALFLLTFLLIISSPSATFASTTDGTIDTSNKYAYSENTGWIDFNATSSAIHVTDTALTGYAYGENIGWISLNCSNTSSCATVDYKVSNNNEGTLSGYAYAENTGWIDFAPTGSGVTINGSGVFSGYAYGENIGWINFNATATNPYPVTTDWRPVSSRNTGNGGGGCSTTYNTVGNVTYATKCGVTTVYSTTGSTGGSSSGSSSSSSDSATQAQAATSTATSTTSTASTTTMCPAGFTCTPLISNITVVCPLGFICTPLTNQQNQNPATLTQYIFTKDLTRGDTFYDVMRLQQFLNSHGFPVAIVPRAGSLGHETTYFGLATLSALKKFQESVGIKPAVGFLGPITRAFIKNMK